MNNNQRLEKAYEILATKLTAKEFDYVSHVMTLLWSGVNFEMTDVLEFLAYTDEAHKKGVLKKKKVHKNNVVKFKVLNGGKS